MDEAQERFGTFLGKLAAEVGGDVDYSETDEFRGYVDVVAEDGTAWQWNVAMDMADKGSFLVVVDNFDGVWAEGQFDTVEQVLRLLPRPRNRRAAPRS